MSAADFSFLITKAGTVVQNPTVEAEAPQTSKSGGQNEALFHTGRDQERDNLRILVCRLREKHFPRPSQSLWTPWDSTSSSSRSRYTLPPVPRVALVGGGRKTRVPQRSGLPQRVLRRMPPWALAEYNPALILLLPPNLRSNFNAFTSITTRGGCTVFILSLILISRIC